MLLGGPCMVWFNIYWIGDYSSCLMVFADFADLLWFQCQLWDLLFCCCSSPTMGTNIMSLASLLAATACTNIIRTAIVFVHNNYFKQFIKVLQLDKSLFKYHSNNYKNTDLNITIVKKTESNSWGRFTANCFWNYRKEQLLCNTHYDTICHVTIMPFHQPGTGRQ